MWQSDTFSFSLLSSQGVKRRDTLLTQSVSFRVTEDDKANRECSKDNEGKTGNNPPQNRSLHKVYIMHVIMSTVLEMTPIPMLMMRPKVSKRWQKKKASLSPFAMTKPRRWPKPIQRPAPRTFSCLIASAH